jgi:hypothetical protein
MVEPILMPFQQMPFNNDSFVQAEFLKIKDKFKITDVIELGTCVGGTAKWFAENFSKVQTVEINSQFRDIALERTKGFDNIISYLGNSVDVLSTMLSKVNSNCIMYADSHWQDFFPLFDELKLIQLSGLKPVIVIHDCKVPNEPNLGYDSYKGVDICFEAVQEYLDLIYGVDGYDYYYNSDATATEIKRGLIYITPKI